MTVRGDAGRDRLTRLSEAHGIAGVLAGVATGVFTLFVAGAVVSLRRR